MCIRCARSSDIPTSRGCRSASWNRKSCSRPNRWSLSKFDMSSPGRIPLLIIGGGIGGLATALAVARTGHRAHVLERSPEFAELGAGLQLAPNASRVLDQVGILEKVQ